MVRIKICGITNIQDAFAAANSGADAVGFIFAESPRKISPEKAKKIIQKLPPFITRVGVFVNEKINSINEIVGYLGLDCVQLHGEESPSFCKKITARVIKSIRIKNKNSLIGISKYKNYTVLLDTFSHEKYGGTGAVFNWDIAASAKKYGMPIILSGGLNPNNICEAIKKVKPYAVDLCSGIEIRQGKKNIKKMKRAIEIAKDNCIISAKR